MRRVVQIALIIVAVLILIAASLPFLVNANQFRPRVQAALTSALNRPVTVGDLSFSLFHGSVSARNLSIAEDPQFGPGPFVTAKSLDLGVALWPLIISHNLIVKDLTITDPVINLVQNQAGRWDFSSMGAKADPPSSGSLDLSAKLVRVENGRVSLTRLNVAEKPMVLENVAVTVNNFARNAPFRFSFDGKLAPAGDIKLDGAAGPINRADASMTPVQLTAKIANVDLAASGISAGSGIAGLLSVDGTGNGNGTMIDWKGQARLNNAKFVRNGTAAKKPVELNFAGQHNLRNHSGTISQGNIHFGNAAATLTGSYMQSGAVTGLNLRLTGSGMPVNTLVGLLPPLDVQLPSGTSLQGGTASVNAAITGPADNPVVAAAVSVNGSDLKGFDLGSKIGALQKLAGIKQSPETEIQTLSAVFRSDASGTTVQNFKLVAPSIGEIDGTGTISSTHVLDFKMAASMNTGGIFAAALGGKSNMSIPFFVKGTSTNPVFEPDVAGIAAAEVRRLTGGAKIGGANAGQEINNVLQGLLGGKKP